MATPLHLDTLPQCTAAHAPDRTLRTREGTRHGATPLTADGLRLSSVVPFRAPPRLRRLRLVDSHRGRVKPSFLRCTHVLTYMLTRRSIGDAVRRARNRRPASPPLLRLSSSSSFLTRHPLDSSSTCWSNRGTTDRNNQRVSAICFCVCICVFVYL